MINMKSAFNFKKAFPNSFPSSPSSARVRDCRADFKSTKCKNHSNKDFWTKKKRMAKISVKYCK